ncbi:MAG: ACT domain-containing protein [Lachnospiraceae bacterium]|nr:ACT domain-containing protein [Lachnospiraceae bacterium]
MERRNIGILSGITGILAEGGISVFAISTYDTDYVLVKDDEFEKALMALNDAGYLISNY